MRGYATTAEIKVTVPSAIIAPRNIRLLFMLISVYKRVFKCIYKQGNIVLY